MPLRADLSGDFVLVLEPGGTSWTLEHREGVVQGFTTRYGLKRLVYVERHPDIGSAIRREQNMKH